MSTSLTPAKKITAVLTSAIMTAFMWRLRGCHGYGSKWGMFCVALTLFLLIYAVFGNRKKMSYEMLPIGVVLSGITAGGWGTINSQMNGYLSSNAYFTGEEVYTYLEISPFSGLVSMLLLGFGWMPLFAIVIGTLFSKKEYKLKDYLIFIGTYYGVMFICNISVSHLIIRGLCPEAVEGAVAGLADTGYDMSPMMAYLKNFGSAAFAKKIPFCRNYFTTIHIISSATGALASSLSVLFILKDKLTAGISVALNAVCAVAITAADLVLILDSDRGFLAGKTAPEFLDANAWGTWEYFTGFLLGFGVMLVLVCLPNRITKSEEDYDYSPLLKNPKLNLAFNSLFTFLFLFGITLSRAFSFRTVEMFVDSDTLEIVVTVILSVIAFIPCFLIAKKNIIDKGLFTPANMLPQQFAQKTLPMYLGIAGLIYFICGDVDRATLLQLPFGELTTAEGLTKYWNDGTLYEPILMIVSFALFFILYFICTRKKNKKSA